MHMMHTSLAECYGVMKSKSLLYFLSWTFLLLLQEPCIEGDNVMATFWFSILSLLNINLAAVNWPGLFQIYPTHIRSVGLGMCSSMARFGPITTPFFAQVSHCHDTFRTSVSFQVKMWLTKGHSVVEKYPKANQSLTSCTGSDVSKDDKGPSYVDVLYYLKQKFQSAEHRFVLPVLITVYYNPKGHNCWLATCESPIVQFHLCFPTSGYCLWSCLKSLIFSQTVSSQSWNFMSELWVS